MRTLSGVSLKFKKKSIDGGGSKTQHSGRKSDSE